MSKTPRELAAEAVSRLLGHPTGNAQTMVNDLTDAEVEAVNRAAESGTPVANQPIARAAIKDVFTAAYERKRKEANKEAEDTMRRDELTKYARHTLARTLDLGYSESADLAGTLTTDGLQALADLADAERFDPVEVRKLVNEHKRTEQAAVPAADAAEATPERKTKPHKAGKRAKDDQPELPGEGE